MTTTPSGVLSRRRDGSTSQDEARHPVQRPRALDPRNRDKGASQGGPSFNGQLPTTLGPSTGEVADLSATLLADVQTGLGNEFMTDGAAQDSAASLIQQHTMGSLALAMAGFDTSSLAPGIAAPSVMRQLMRRSQAEAEGLDTDKAAGRIGSRTGQALPDAVRVRMERAFGHDFSHVRIHTDGGAASAADALHAVAFAIGRDIYFGPGAWRPGTPAGDELLAHELTHVMQADEGRLPTQSSSGGMDVSRPTDPHEREAEEMGRKVAQALGQGSIDASISDGTANDVAPTVDTAATAPVSTGGGSAPTAEMDLGVVGPQDVVSTEGPTHASTETTTADASALLSREATSSTQTASTPTTGTSATTSSETADSEATTAPPAYATLTIAGKAVQVRVPASEGKTATAEVAMDERPVEGVHLTSATVNIDADGVVVGGTVRGILEVEGYFAGTGVSFGILPGGQVAPGVKDVPINIGPVTGTMDLELNETGLTGVGKIAAADLGLPAWIGVEGGDLEIRFGEGSLSGNGTLQGTPTETGSASVSAELADKTLTAVVTYTVTPGLEPIPGVRINSAVLQGTITKSLVEGEGAQPDVEAATAAAGPDTDSAPAATNTPATRDFRPSAGQTAEGAGAGEGESAGGDTAQATAATMSENLAAAQEGGEQEAGAADADAFKLRGTGNVTLKDWVNGDLDVAYDPAAGTYDLSGTLSAEKEMQFGEILATKSSIAFTVEHNVPTEVKAIIDFTAPRVIGKITGDYDVQAHSLDGTATARLSHNWPLEADWGEFRLLRHGRLNAIVTDNELTEINGRVRFDAKVNGISDVPLELAGTVEGTFDTKEDKVNGTATGSTAADFILPTVAAPEGGAEGAAAETFTLLQGSTLRATVTDNALSQVGMDAALRYDRDGAPFLAGALVGATYDVEKGELSGEGQFTLLKSLERSTKGGEWTVRLMEGSQVTAKVAKNSLTEIGGSVTVQVDDAQGPLANGIIDNAKIKVGSWETSGMIKLTTARKFYHPGEGQTLANGYSLEVLPGSGISGTIKDDELTDVGADLRTMIKDEEGSLARLRLQADWDLEKDEVDGKGTLSLAREFVVAENLAGLGWTAKVLRGTKAIGHIENNDFTKVTGELKAGVDDDQGRFLDVTGAGEWTTADDLFDIVGTITVAREKELASSEGGWSISLTPEASTATATIEDDVFKGIEGTIATMVRRTGEDFAKLSLGGKWNETDGFTGKGEAELLTDIDVAQISQYHLWVTKGTGAQLEVKSDEISEIGGAVPMRLDENDQPFIKGQLQGTYKIKEKVLDGSGTAQVLVEKHLGSLGSDQLWLVPSSNATATVANNELTSVGGELNLSIRNDDGQYALVALNGTFDAAGGTGFTGTGGVTVTRDNQLFAVDDYSFWLKEGTGAVAHIEQDTLKLIDGSVPFMVKDGGTEPLIQGSVTGSYDPATGQINGTGAVYLGRTLEYDLGGGVMIKLLQGSGGDADVKESQLQRLGGSLTAELWKDGEGIVRVTADGEYNVVTNTLTRLEGQATLLKPLSLMGDSIIVSEVSGHATIENNELVAAGGSGNILIKPLNNMTGTFEVEWSNRGGNEQYSGRGWLDFTLIDTDPETGRGMSGRVFAEVKSDDTFSAIGEIDYRINEVIGGKLQVSVDEKWDPLLYGTMVVDTDLVDARDLFSLEKDIVPEKSVPLGYGLAMFFGMKGGMSMGLDALHMNANIVVGDWRPLSEDASVPRFESALNLTWGMNFKAMIAPYLGIGGDIGFASAQMGLRGEVELNAPVKADAGGLIKGDGGGFYGELSVGVSIAPTIDLAIIPYIKGEVLDMLTFEEDLARFEQPLGEVFNFEWGGKYIFGDTSRKDNAPIRPVDIPSPTQKNDKVEGKPDLGMGNSSGSANNKKGAPQIEGGSEIAGNQGIGGGGGEMAEVMETINDVVAVVKALGAAGTLMGMLASALLALATFGPAGLIVHIVWGIFTGDLSWDRISTAVTDLIDGIGAAGRLLSKHMPGWWNSIKDVFSGDKPGLLDALFGADDRMREAVGRGDHRYAPYDMHKEMVKAMAGGWLSTDDANCIAQIFEVSGRRGELSSLVSACGGSDEFIDGWSTGFNDEAIKRAFNRYGIRYDD
jgi:hypothetical protein